MSQTRKISGVSTRVYTYEGVTSVSYHGTEVVKFDNKHIALNTGGWFTNTTKTRMNQTSNQFGLGFSVYQKGWNWFVDFKGETIAFDGSKITLER